ncbi:DHHA1 domain-containing protein, partial [Patescibacteria group bacterium]
HILAPRINAMGRLDHAIDALRLLCTKKEDRAMVLARQLGLTNKKRQDMTQEAAIHAKRLVAERRKDGKNPKLIFLSHESYNQGIIGLIAGRLVEEYYLPAIVLSEGKEFSKASARSIKGFNIVETIRKASDLLVDVGGHPMAAGFTVESSRLESLRERLESIVETELLEELLDRELSIELALPFSIIDEELWKTLEQFEPYGIGNARPVFCTKQVEIMESRLVGKDKNHLRLNVTDYTGAFQAIGFRMGEEFGDLVKGDMIHIAYTIDLNIWNGRRELQLKIKDIQRV